MACDNRCEKKNERVTKSNDIMESKKKHDSDLINVQLGQSILVSTVK